MKIWQQEDVTSLFEATGIPVHKPLVVSFSKATYEFDPNPKANWLYYAFLAFIKLAATIKELETVAVVGTGSGLDGIGIYETLRPKRLQLTDVHPKVIPVARLNLQNYFTTARAKVKWDVVLGNLCGPLLPESVDMVYANIPTIPGNPSRILTGMNSSSFYDPDWAKNCPVSLERNYLGLQYEFLRQARIALKPGGLAAVALGVRMNACLVEKLFCAAKFSGYEPVVLDLKEQSQPKAVVASYARQERSGGTSFDFYREESLQVRPGSKLSLPEFKQSLLEWKVSAQEAFRLVRRGEKIYHVIAILGGQK